MDFGNLKIGERGIETPPTLKDKVKCFFGKHDFVAVKKLSSQCYKIKCRKCQRYWAINHTVQSLLPWDKEMADFYEMFNKL